MPLNIISPSIDVWSLKDAANYVVEYDRSLQKITVTVQNVDGLIDNQTYILGRARDVANPEGQPYYSYMCESVDPAGECTGPAEPTAPICFHYSPYSDGCIEYNTDTQTFIISPSQTAPGVMFFDGNVSINNGNSFTTVLASGNITTNGEFVHEAANSGGYNKVCEGDASHAAGGVKVRYQLAFSKHYPTNLCDKSIGSYIPSPTGNIGLAAGGVNPDTSVNPSGNFSGGDIDLGGSSHIIGAVLAGNVLVTNSGSVTIQGLVSAGAKLNDGSINNLSAKTIIDFDNTDDYDPFDIPTSITSTPNTTPPVKVATMLWSRPL